MTMVILKAIGIWCILVVCAILNGLLRENILNPFLGQQIALPVSGLILSLLILAVTWLFIPFFETRPAMDYWLIGALWLGITLAFEFMFGHYAMGKSWQDIFQVFNIFKGNLFLLTLLASLVAPRLMARLRGFL
ncbi:MAG TPA: hypothetical protein VIQ03_01875 [Gammaproteobacteria bacterium]